MTKWQTNQLNIQVGELGLLKDDMVHPQFWPLGRVVRTIPNKVSKVRIVEVMTSDKKLVFRAFSKVVILPIDKRYWTVYYLYIL